MSRLLSPDGSCRQVEVVGAQTGRKRTYGSFGAEGGGVIEASGADARTLRQAGFTDASASGALHNAGTGYVCTGCNRGSFFTTCGRCGAVCVKPGGGTT